MGSAASGPFTVSLEEIGVGDAQRCGGKASSLGELTRAGARVPPGFCIVAAALPRLLEASGLGPRIAAAADSLDFGDPNAVEAATAPIRELIAAAAIPADLEAEILERYRALAGPEQRFVAVRSSVAVADSPISSFPGMMDTYHYVRGEADVLVRVRECWASLWTARAAFARHRQGIAHERGLIAPVVQAMIDADCAGVLFTANPITGATDQIVIEANFGIGESVVSGRSLNDFYVLDKQTLAVSERRIARKTVMVTLDRGKGSDRLEEEVPPGRASEPVLADSGLAELGETSLKIERHFGFPVDVEWAFEHDRLYILQARRITGLGPAPGERPERGES
ncbi:MAG: hypothetical protein IT201_11960 [Thermoleophilia bacterium]|nr:hypothetical protein [Thermoleophilia bacterium]